MKSEYRDYRRRDMSMEDFKKLVPYLNEVKSVVLEGWGESLLHPNVFDFIGMVKREGAEAGFVTSGYGLDEDRIRELIRRGIDFLGFSFSGATPETHQRIRINSNFEQLLASIRAFFFLSKEMKMKVPKMHIVYLLLKENVEESPLILDLAKSLKIKEVVFLNIIQISNEEQDNMKVFTYSGRSPYEDIMLEAKRKAASYGIKLFTPSLTQVDVAMCPENPLNSIYISVDGEVSPCVYLNPPVKSPFRRIFEGKAYEIENISFGNLFEEPLEQIWNKEPYRAFREAHERRERAGRELFESLINLSLRGEYTLPPPPEPCKTCHKMKGF